MAAGPPAPGFSADGGRRVDAYGGGRLEPAEQSPLSIDLALVDELCPKAQRGIKDFRCRDPIAADVQFQNPPALRR
jgi:hypothetical protein